MSTLRAGAKPASLTTNQYLWRLLRFDAPLFIANIIVWTIFHSFPLVIGLITGYFFDALSGKAPFGMNAWTIVVLVVLAGLTRFGIEIGGHISWYTYYFKMQGLLRRNLFRWVMTGPGTHKLPDSSGEAMSRFRDDVEEVGRVFENVVDLWGIALYVIGGVAIMLTINAFITIVAFIPFAALLVLTNLLSHLLKRVRRANRESTGRVTDHIGEMFGAAQAVKVASAEAHVVAHFHTLNEARRRAALRDTFITALLQSLNNNMGSIGAGIVMLLAVASFRSGSFTVGDLAIFITYLSGFSNEMAFIGTTLARQQQVGVSFERMAKVMDGAAPEALVAGGELHLTGALPAVPAAARADADRLTVLTAQGLAYRYPHSDRGIAAIDLQVRRGSFTVITGRIGAGKTTLLRALLGLLPRDAGAISWNGAEITDPSLFLTPPRCAYTPQIPRLFSETLRDNILLGAAGGRRND